MVSNFNFVVQQRYVIIDANQPTYYKTKTRVTNNLMRGNESSTHDVRKCGHWTPLRNYIENEWQKHEQ